jgi:hypothetical protein
MKVAPPAEGRPPVQRDTAFITQTALRLRRRHRDDRARTSTGAPKAVKGEDRRRGPRPTQQIGEAGAAPLIVKDGERKDRS